MSATAPICDDGTPPAHFDFVDSRKFKTGLSILHLALGELDDLRFTQFEDTEGQVWRRNADGRTEIRVQLAAIKHALHDMTAATRRECR